MIINLLAKLMLISFALFMSTSMAFAGLTVDGAKSQGLVGEKPDGLLGIVTGAPSADVQALVNSTNSQRMEKYSSIAAKNAAAVDQIQAVAGQKLITSTPAGEYFMNASGSWQKR